MVLEKSESVYIVPIMSNYRMWLVEYNLTGWHGSDDVTKLKGQVNINTALKLNKVPILIIWRVQTSHNGLHDKYNNAHCNYS